MVEHPPPLDVHNVHEQLDAAAVAEHLGLELAGDRPGLVPHVARIVAEARDLNLGGT